jgi:hypothetical protein
MSLEDLGNIGEFLAAIGVIISLIYLAVQIRQNSAYLAQNIKSVQTSTLLAARVAGNEFPSMVAQDAEAARISTLGFGNAADLSPLDRLRFYSMLSTWFVTQETMFLLHKADAIDRELYATWERNLRQILSLPSVAEWCRETASFTDSFARLVYGILDELERES